MLEIIKDIDLQPSIFDSNGSYLSEEINDWLIENDIEIPEDLKEFWSYTGGGYIFESENLLAPDLNYTQEDILSVNQWYWENGLDENLLIFNTGAFLSAVGLKDKKYYLLENQDFYIEQTFKDFDDWYKNTIKLHFADRYGLTE